MIIEGVLPTLTSTKVRIFFRPLLDELQGSFSGSVRIPQPELLRSVLTILGISVGVGAFICVVAIGNAGSSMIRSGDCFRYLTNRRYLPLVSSRKKCTGASVGKLNGLAVFGSRLNLEKTAELSRKCFSSVSVLVALAG